MFVTTVLYWLHAPCDYSITSLYCTAQVHCKIPGQHSTHLHSTVIQIVPIFHAFGTVPTFSSKKTVPIQKNGTVPRYDKHTI